MARTKTTGGHRGSISAADTPRQKRNVRMMQTSRSPTTAGKKPRASPPSAATKIAEKVNAKHIASSDNPAKSRAASPVIATEGAPPAMKMVVEFVFVTEEQRVFETTMQNRLDDFVLNAKRTIVPENKAGAEGKECFKGKDTWFGLTVLDKEDGKNGESVVTMLAYDDNGEAKKLNKVKVGSRTFYGNVWLIRERHDAAGKCIAHMDVPEQYVRNITMCMPMRAASPVMSDDDSDTDEQDEDTTRIVFADKNGEVGVKVMTF